VKLLFDVMLIYRSLPFSFFEASKEDDVVTLDLGLSDYRDMLGTHYSPILEKTMARLKEEGRGRALA